MCDIINETSIMEEAINRCMSEMYEKAQPSASWNEYLEKAKNGEITKDDLIYERHFLPHKEFEYILNKYKKAYRFENKWRSNCDLILEDLEKGGLRDIYVTDKDGMGHRDAEHTKPLEELIGKEHAEIVFDLIKAFKNFYRFDRDEETFGFHIALGASPTSNPDTVKKYWKSQGIDIQIDEKENFTESDYWEIDH